VPATIPDSATVASNGDGHIAGVGDGANTLVVSGDCTGAVSNG